MRPTYLDLLDFIRDQFVLNILHPELVIDQTLQVGSAEVDCLPAGARITHGNYAKRKIAHDSKQLVYTKRSVRSADV